MIHFLLSLIVFLPLFGAFITILIPVAYKGVHRVIAFSTTLLTFLMSCFLVTHFDPTVGERQYIESFAWISTLNISYLIGVDGLSLIFIPLSSLLFLLCIISSWDQNNGAKGYFSLLLFLETSILGIFVAQDLFLFFSFWLSSLLPIYFLIGIWGGENKEYSATKFFIYQLVGCSLILLGLLTVYYSASPHSFNLMELIGGKFINSKITIGNRELRLEPLAFGLLFLGFAIRLPIVPFHSWFPHVLVEAPSSLKVLIAALFIKTSAYAIVRVNYSLFPEATHQYAPVIAIIGTINILYGAFCALGQKDLRKIIAYNCISHIGFAVLGLSVFSATAFHGALLGLLSHGIYVGLLFFLVGIIGVRSGEYRLVGVDGKLFFGGIVFRAPILTAFFTIAVFSALGVPGLGAFVSDLLTFLGVFPFRKSLTIIAIFSLVLTAGYFLWMYKRLILGQPHKHTTSITDLTPRDQLILLPLVILCFIVGTYPAPLLKFSQATINQILSSLGPQK